MSIVAEAAVINLGSTTYAKTTFLLPGHAPDASIASYKAIFDKNDYYYIITKGGARSALRLTTPSLIVVPLPASVTTWHIKKPEDTVIPISAVATDGSKYGDEYSADTLQSEKNDDHAEEQPISLVSTTSTTSLDHKPSSSDTDYSLDSEASFKDANQDQIRRLDESLVDESASADAKQSECVTSDTEAGVVLVGAGNINRTLQGNNTTTEMRSPYSSISVIGKVGAEPLSNHLVENRLASQMKATSKPQSTVVPVKRSRTNVTRAICQPQYTRVVVLQEMSEHVICSKPSDSVAISSSSRDAAVTRIFKPCASSSNSGIPGGFGLTDTIVYQVLPGYILHEYKVNGTWFFNVYEDLTYGTYEDLPPRFESAEVFGNSARKYSGMQSAISKGLVKPVGNISINLNAQGIESSYAKDMLKTVTMSAFPPFKDIIQSMLFKPSSVNFNYDKSMVKSAGRPTIQPIKDVSRLLQ